MFTAIKTFFGSIGLTGLTIRLILILLIIGAIIGTGLFFHTTIENWLGARAYDAELAQTVNEDKTQLNILTQTVKDQANDIATLKDKISGIQQKFGSVNGHIQASVQALKNANKVSPPAGPITQQTVDDLRKIWPTTPTGSVKASTPSTNPSIEAFKNEQK